MRLIDADALHRVYMSKGKDKLRLATVINEIEMQKTIDAVPVVHGRWIWNETGKPDWEQFYTCSNCGDREYWESHYCHNCGAKMDLEVDGDG